MTPFGTPYLKMLDTLRSTKWRLARGLLSVLPFRLLKQLADVKLISFYYHLVSNHLPAHLSELYSDIHSSTSFEEEIDSICKEFTPVSAEILIDHIETGTRLPKNPCLITFDDGYREVYEHAFPILHDRKIPFVFFITSNFLDNKSLFVENTISLIENVCKHNPDRTELVSAFLLHNGYSLSRSLAHTLYTIPYKKRSMVEDIATICDLDTEKYLQENRPYVTTDEVRRMLATGLVDVGGHSIDHPRSEELTTEEQIHQIAHSMEKMSNTFNPKHRLYAFPYSDRSITEDVYKRLFNELHIDLAFGTNELQPSRNSRIIQRCWMDASSNNSPRTKLKSIFQEEILRKWKGN